MDNLVNIIEAILFTMGESVELSKIAEVIELDKKETKLILEEEKEMNKFNAFVIDKIINIYGNEIKNREV